MIRFSPRTLAATLMTFMVVFLGWILVCNERKERDTPHAGLPQCLFRWAGRLLVDMVEVGRVQVFRAGFLYGAELGAEKGAHKIALYP